MNKQSNFKAMHQQSELLFLANAWDVLSAMVLEQSGFKAIGTTSWGVSNSMGYKDGETIEFSALLTMASKIVSAVNIPVTVDIESGYSEHSNTIVENVLRIAEMGAVGINFEDSLKGDSGLVDMSRQCGLLEKIRSRLNQHGHDDFFINARIDTYLQLQTPLNETIDRAIGYVKSGASGIFVPGMSKSDDIKSFVKVVDAPLNLMSLKGLTDVSSLNELGVKRFSIGNALSDATTIYMEQQSHRLLAERNTIGLYGNVEVKTVFK